MVERNINFLSMSHLAEDDTFEYNNHQFILHPRLIGNKIKQTSPYVTNNWKLKVYTPFKTTKSSKEPTHPNLVLLRSGINHKSLTEKKFYSTIEEENELPSHRINSLVGNRKVFTNARTKTKVEIYKELKNKNNLCSGNISSSSSNVFQQKADSRQKCSENYSLIRHGKRKMNSHGRFEKYLGASASESSFTNVKVIHPPKHEGQCSGDFGSRSTELLNLNQQKWTKKYNKQYFNGKARENKKIDLNVSADQKTIKENLSNSAKANKRRKYHKIINNLEESLQSKIEKQKKNILDSCDYPILISDNNEACGSIEVVPSPSQFSGLESQIWPFMVNWLPQKKRKGILYNSLAVKSSHKLNAKGPTKQFNTINIAKSKHSPKTSDNTIFDKHKATSNTESMNKSSVKTNRTSSLSPSDLQCLDKGNTDKISLNSNINTEVIDIKRLLKYVSNGIYTTDEDIPKAHYIKDDISDHQCSHRKNLKADTNTKRLRNECLSKQNNPKELSDAKLVQPQNQKSIILSGILEKIRHGVYFNDPHDTKMQPKQTRYVNLSQKILEERNGKIHVNYVVEKEKAHKRKLNKHELYMENVIKCVKIPGFRNPLSSLMETLGTEFVMIKDTRLNAAIKFEIGQIDMPLSDLDKVTPLIDSFHVAENKFLKCTARLKLSVALLPAQLCSILPKIVNEIENNRDTVYKYVSNTDEDPNDAKETLREVISICLPHNAPQVKPVSRSLPDIIQPKKSHDLNSLCTNLSVRASYEPSLLNNESMEITHLPSPLNNSLTLSDEYCLKHWSSITENDKCLEESSSWKQVSVSKRICKSAINYNALAMKSEMNLVSSSAYMVDKVNNTEEHLSVKCVCILSLFYQMYSTLFRLTKVFKIYLILTSYMRRGNDRMICGKDQYTIVKSQHMTCTKHLFRDFTRLSQSNCNNTINYNVADSEIDSNATMRAHKYRQNEIETQQLSDIDKLLDFLWYEFSSDLFDTIGSPQKDNIKFAMVEIKKRTKIVNKSQVLLIFLLCTRDSNYNSNESLKADLINAILNGAIKTTEDLNKRCKTLEYAEEPTKPSEQTIKKNQSTNEVIQTSDKGRNSILEELYNIALSTASARKMSVNENVKEELEQLIKKNPQANLSYLRVMARYAGLGLLKQKTFTSRPPY